jgi:CheY-like chemotaxis protein
LRRELLEAEGCDVETTRNKQHGLAILHSDSFDLLIMGNSLTNNTKLEYSNVTPMTKMRTNRGSLLMAGGRCKKTTCAMSPVG